MSRSEFSPSVRMKAWDRCVGKCEWPGCGAKLYPGRFAFDHIIADGLGGSPTLENCQVLCRPHHDEKTFSEDNPRMTKADNQKKAHLGIKAKSRPMPGSKASGVRKKMNGKVVRR